MSDLQQVMVFVQGQHWAEAKMLCTSLCQTSENKNADAWFLLGAIHGQLGKFDEAEKCCRQAIALRPGVPMAIFNLGIALQKQGKLAESIDCFQQVVALNPNYAEAHNELGATLQLTGVDQLDAAVKCYRQALALKPDYPVARYNLAAGLRALGQDEEARIHFKEALRLHPGMIEASVAYATLLRDSENFDQAEAVLESALRLNPNDLTLRFQVGKTLADKRRYRDAADIFNQLLEVHPESEAISTACAQVLERLGEFEKGLALLRPFLASGTDNPSTAVIYAALARHFGQQEEAATLLERVLLNGNLDKGIQKAMYYALGKLCDELRKYDRAFECFQNAGALEKAQFDPQTTERMFSTITTFFNSESIRRRPRASNKSQLPVFIVGMPRSGTSLVEQILSSHTQVYGAGELHEIGSLHKKIPAQLNLKELYPYCLDEMKRSQVDKVAGQHLAMLGAFSRSATRVTDKMPHNFLYLGLIDMLFPGARVIHCMRNPIDNCLSIFTHEFSEAHAYAANLTSLGVHYRWYQKMMDHWKQVLRIPILDVQYENMVANQEEESRRLVEFCGLKWEESCLRFHENKRVVTTFSYDQVRRPIYTKSVARWKNYEHHLGPLISALDEKA